MLLPPQAAPVELPKGTRHLSANPRGVRLQDICVQPTVCSAPNKICYPCVNGKQYCFVGRHCYNCDC